MSEHDSTTGETAPADIDKDTSSQVGSTVAVEDSPQPAVEEEAKAAVAPTSRRLVVALGAVAAITTVLAAVFGTLWATDGSDDELTSLTGKIAAEGEAERVAGDYALSVSKVDHEDIGAWRRALETGVTQQLKEKMATAVDVVAPLLTQMQYVSTAEKLAATVAHSDGNTYVVRVFVDMDSTSRQTPDGVAATASYTITLDRGSDWTITDVGGLGAGLPGQGSPAPAGGN